MQSPLRILLVEDDDVDREYVRRLFGKYGRPVAVTEAASLSEARKILRRQHFDCVLLDYHLRGELGLDLIPNVLVHRQEICPIVLVTLRESESLIVEAMRLGVTDYVAKANLNVDKLRDIVAKALERAEIEQLQREAKARLQEVTEKLRAEHEETLQRSADEAQRSARAKSMFLANMSHEIRTPLNAVVGLSYLLQRTQLSEEQRDLVNRIKLASNGLLRVVNNVLDISKLGASALRLEKIPFSLHRMLEDLIGLLGVQGESKGVTPDLEISDAMPRAVVGDPGRLHQVLGNLLTNAVKFTPSGAVHLRARVVSRDGNRARIRFEVQDTGIGVAPESLAGLFQPFAQADASTTRRFGGTGLGLSIARELVLLMEGSIGADSRPGEGSLFWVDVEFEIAQESAIASASKQSVMGTLRLSGVSVLLVDDSDVNLEVGKAILEGEGAFVQTACNGQVAVDMVLRTPAAFDIIVMDLQMPVLDGVEAFRRIASVLGEERPVVVALTAGDLTDASGEASASGMEGLMHKPFDVDELVHWIRSHVGMPETAVAIKASSDLPGWPEVSGVDSSIARAQMGDNQTLFKVALKTFNRQYADLETMLVGGDANEVRRIVHRLKGSAATVGAQTLYDLALRTEAALKAEDSTGLAAVLRQVCEHFEQLRESIHRFLAHSESQAAA